MSFVSSAAKQPVFAHCAGVAIQARLPTFSVHLLSLLLLLLPEKEDDTANNGKQDKNTADHTSNDGTRVGSFFASVGSVMV